MTTDDRAAEAVDVAMLQSMAAAFRQDMPFSLNRFDMAELMERCAATLISGHSAAVDAGDRQVIFLEKQSGGEWLMSRGDGQISVTGTTPADALRSGADLLEDLERLFGAARGGRA